MWTSLVLLALGHGVVCGATASITDIQITSPANGTYTAAAAPVSFTVTFSQDVTVTGTPTFTLNSGGAAVFQSYNAVTFQAIFKYTIAAGDTTAGAALFPTSTLSTVAVQTNPVGQTPATWSLPGGSTLSGQAIVIDAVAPLLTAVNAVDVNPSTATTAHFLVSFSEPVQNVVLADFSCSIAGTSLSLSGSGAQYTVTVSGIPATAGSIQTVALTIIPGTIQDGAGNLLGPIAPSPDEHYLIDHAAPSLVSVTRLDPDPTTASSVRFLATFSEPMQNVSSANFTCATGGTTIAVAGSGSQYTVTVGAIPTTAGTVLNVSLGFAAGSMADQAGNAIAAIAPTPDDAYTVDHAAPTLASVTRLDANPSTAASVRFLASFSEPMQNVSNANFTCAIGGTTLAVAGSGSQYTVTVGSIPTTAGTVQTASLGFVAGSMKDLAGNAVAALAPSPNDSYSIDHAAPTLSSITRLDPDPTTATSVRFLATFSEPVVNVASANFTCAVAGTTVSAVPSGAQCVVTVANIPTTAGTTVVLGLTANAGSIQDTAGNGLAAIAPAPNDQYTIDHAPPSLTSVTRLDASPTAAGSVRFLATFSEPVLNVLVGDFSCALGGTTVSLAGSGSQYTVTVANLPGSGTAGLSVISGTIRDAAGNSLAAIAPSPNDQYALDRTAPAVQSVLTVGPATTNSTSVLFTIIFTEPVTGVTAGMFSISPAWAGATLGGLSGSGNAYQLTVSNINGNGPLGLALVTPSAITDLASNPLNPSGGLYEVYTINQATPTLTLNGGSSTFFHEKFALNPPIFRTTTLNDVGDVNFVVQTPTPTQGSIDVAVTIPTTLPVAPRTISSDGSDSIVFDVNSIAPPATEFAFPLNPSGTDGAIVMFGVTIGSYAYSQGKRAMHLVIDGTNGNVSVIEVQKLVNIICFTNPGHNPSPSTRRASIIVTDGKNRTSTTLFQDIPVSLYNDTLVGSVIVPNPAQRVTTAGLPLSGVVQATDVDSFFSYTVIAPLPTLGTVGVTASGIWTYTPNPGATGTDHFTIRVQDQPLAGQWAADAPLAATDVVQAVSIVLPDGSTQSPRFSSNPPLEAEVEAAFSYRPTIDPGSAPGPIASTTFDLIGLSNAQFDATHQFTFDSTTGQLQWVLTPSAPNGYFDFEILVQVTDANGITRGTVQPILLKPAVPGSGGN